MVFFLKKRVGNLFRIVQKKLSAKNKLKKEFIKLGISKRDILNFQRFSKSQKLTETYETSLLGNSVITFNNSYWYYHSIEEVFLDEVYKCFFEQDDPYILDCGANIGLSVIYFKRQYPKAKIIAFEPDENNFNKLVKNIQSFDLSEVTIIKKGVWKEETNLLFFPDGHLGGTVMHSNFSISDGLPNTPFVRLRDFLDVKVNFLKIDIEGAEYEVMNDIKDKLENVENIFLEYHGDATESQKLHEMLLWISEAGFRYHIKFACENQKHPFIEKRKTGWDLQLNIFCYR